MEWAQRSDAARFYRGQRVLVTGGLGFVGSNLAHRLVELGCEVLLVDSLIPDYGGSLHNVADIADRVRVNIADIRDQNGLRYLVQGQNTIFNLASQVSHIDSQIDPFTDLEINCRSQLSLLEACRERNRGVKIVFASTRQIYGKPIYLPVDEEHPKRPTDVNGINKMAGEWYHILYNNVHGIRATSLRLTNTFGPRQLVKHNRQGFLPWFIRQAIDGEEIALFGDGSQLRDVNYVDDVVDAFLLAGMCEQANGQFYNLGGTPPMSLREIAEAIIRVAGSGSYRLVAFPAEKKAIDVGSVYQSADKIGAALDWRARVPFEEGLARTIAFYRAHRDHYWQRPTGGDRDSVQRPGATAPVAEGAAGGHR